MKQYIPIENSEKQLEIKVSYSLGGMNYFNYKTEARGYYLMVTPVKVGAGFMEYSAFSGTKTLLLETKRKSDKAYNEACKLVDSRKQELIDHVMEKIAVKNNGKELANKLGFTIAPRFHHLTYDQIMAMPVQVVGLEPANQIFNSVKECPLDLKKLLGAMYGEVNGKPALRFETQAAYNMLSN